MHRPEQQPALPALTHGFIRCGFGKGFCFQRFLCDDCKNKGWLACKISLRQLYILKAQGLHLGEVLARCRVQPVAEYTPCRFSL